MVCSKRMDYKLDTVLLLTIGFAFASILGVVAARIKLPPILGFLLAGYLIGPYSPGFVAEVHTAEQLAEIGVILMLFGVGLHFKLQDLINVKMVAIPGALGQTAAATIIGALAIYCLGYPIDQGVIIGLAISVASTVVLVRALTDNHMLDTLQGHIAIGWLIVEDILTIFMLVLLPVLAEVKTNQAVSLVSLGFTIVFFLAKFLLLAFLLIKWGDKVVGWLLTLVARLRSQELFTLSVLAVTFGIATLSAYLFDTSIALGAFLAGMVIGQTDVRHQALANSLPLKDVFAVIFFLSIGMLFDPVTIGSNWPLLLAILAVILIVKPIVAYAIVYFLRYSRKVSLTVAISLMQIGEFSFILAEQATNLRLLPDAGFDLLVGAAIISISLNPLFFRLLGRFDEGRDIRVLDGQQEPNKLMHLFEASVKKPPEVIVVGFGVVGEAVTQFLEEQGVEVIVVESNIDTLAKQSESQSKIVYGDASVPNILQVTEITKASLLVITVLEIATTVSIIKSARHLNPHLHIIARVTFAQDVQQLKDLDVEYVCSEDEVKTAIIELLPIFSRD